MNEAFLRTQMLLGADALDTLSRCHVIVFGLGGVAQTVQRSVHVSGKGPVLWRACLQLRWVSTRFH